MKNTKILLIEFVNIDMHPGQCGMTFPFIKGYSLKKNIPVKWIRFGVRAAVQFIKNTLGIDLDIEEKTNLDKIIKEFAPSHILFSDKSSEELIASIKNSQSIKIDFLESSEGKDKFFNINELIKWLNLHEKDNSSNIYKSIIEEVTPDYNWESGNKLALQKTPIIHIFSGPGCLYSKSIKKNKFYKDIDLSKAFRDFGCSFCTTNKVLPVKSGENYFNIVIKHLEIAKKTAPKSEIPYQYIIHSAYIFHNILNFFEKIKSLNLNKSDFLFNCRVDEVVKMSNQIEKSVKLIQKNNHTINIYLIGIENFSQPELDRMNKGLKVIDILNCIKLLKNWENKYPKTFFFKKYGGFSTILFTPWTTLEDLEINIKMVKLLKLESVCGKFFYSRLRLYKELPITLLAEKNNLIIEKYNDPALDTAKRTFYSKEIPWKFKHSEIEIINRISTRLIKDDALSNDKLYIEIQNFIHSFPINYQSPFYIFELLLKIIKNNIEEKNINIILKKLSELIYENDTSDLKKNITADYKKINYDYYSKNSKYKLLRTLCEKGLKPVLRIEFLNKTLFKELLENEEIKKFNSYKIRKKSEDNSFELYLGNQNEDLTNIINYIEIIEKSKNLEDIKNATKNVGKLLGYPECCSIKFANETQTAQNLDNWLILDRRIKTPGKISPLMNPFTQFTPNVQHYIPCSFECEKSLELFEKINNIQIDLNLSLFSKEKLNEIASYPYLFLLNSIAAIELFPEDINNNMIKYIVKDTNIMNNRLASIVSGNKLIIEEEKIIILNNNKKIDSFILEASIWWHEKSFFPDFWKKCIDEAFIDKEKDIFNKINPNRNNLNLPERDNGKKSDYILNEKPKTLFFKTINNKLSLNKNYNGYSINEIIEESKDVVRIKLHKNNTYIIIYIKPKNKTKNFFISTSEYAIQYNSETPINSEEKHKAVKILSQTI